MARRRKQKNTPTLNRAEAESPAASLQRVTFNASGKARRDTLEGRDYLVVPMVMLTEGVHAGSDGPLLYPADELKKTPAVWNYKPIVVYHPTQNGVGISACEPVVINTRKVGVIMNTKYRKGKLHAEAWLEEGRLEAVDRRVLNSIQADEMMELSTGLFTDNEPAPRGAVWNGEAYSYIARNYRPDHLALLPDETGACSIADGAGLLRLNSGYHRDVVAAAQALAQAEADRLTANAKSWGDITQDLYLLVQKKWGGSNNNGGPGAWVQDVYDKFFIFSVDGKLYKQGFAVDAENDVALVGDRVEVQRVSEYRTVDGAYVGNAATVPHNVEVPKMDKKQIVDGLIANAATSWTEADRNYLMTFDAEQLSRFAPLPAGAVKPTGNAAPATPTVPTPAPAATPAPATTPVANTAPAAKLQTWEEIVANADPATRGMLGSMRAEYDAQRQALIGKITANARNQFTAEQLAAMDLPTLKSLGALAEAPAAVVPAAPLYAGLGDAPPAPVGNAAVPPPLVPPTMNFAKAS